MLYEVNFDNTKNIKLNENIFNCSIKIAILNKTFNAGLIKEKRYLELKQNILQEYNLTHIGIWKFNILMYNKHIMGEEDKYYISNHHKPII